MYSDKTVCIEDVLSNVDASEGLDIIGVYTRNSPTLQNATNKGLLVYLVGYMAQSTSKEIHEVIHRAKDDKPWLVLAYGIYLAIKRDQI